MLVAGYWFPKIFVLGVFVATLLAYYYLDFFDVLLTNAVNAYEIFGSNKEHERIEQFYSLIEGWASSGIHLLIGWGNGASADVIRSAEMPWAYELTYIYLLFSTGAIGVVFYFGWFAWGLVRLRRAMLSRPDLLLYVAPMVSGVIGLCIAAITNPYFAKFDYLWVVLLPHLLAGGVKYQSQVVRHSYA
jgi:hypothetical protein